MSCYIVDNKTISALAKAFVDYGVKYRAENYKDTNPFGCAWIIDTDSLKHDIGQSLLEQNYASWNYRYDENDETPNFEYEEVYIDEGIISGLIKCYEYQACETDDYFQSDIHKSLTELKAKLFDRLLMRCGMKEYWGYDIYMEEVQK